MFSVDVGQLHALRRLRTILGPLVVRVSIKCAESRWQQEAERVGETARVDRYRDFVAHCLYVRIFV
jgi:hypothetical protein